MTEGKRDLCRSHRLSVPPGTPSGRSATYSPAPPRTLGRLRLPWAIRTSTGSRESTRDQTPKVLSPERSLGPSCVTIHVPLRNTTQYPLANFSLRIRPFPPQPLVRQVRKVAAIGCDLMQSARQDPTPADGNRIPPPMERSGGTSSPIAATSRGAHPDGPHGHRGG